MKKLLVPLLGAVLLVTALAAPAQAAKQGQCANFPQVNLRLCASVNWANGNVWMTGQGRELTNTAFGEYVGGGALLRQSCRGGDWRVIGEDSVRGNEGLTLVTPTFRIQKGYRYRASTVSSRGLKFGVVSSPVLSRC